MYLQGPVCSMELEPTVVLPVGFSHFRRVRDKGKVDPDLFYGLHVEPVYGAFPVRIYGVNQRFYVTGNYIIRVTVWESVML